MDFFDIIKQVTEKLPLDTASTQKFSKGGQEKSLVQ